MGKIFQCPHCKSEEGYWGEIQVKGLIRYETKRSN